MVAKSKEIRFVLLVSVLSLSAIPLSSWLAHKPLRAETPSQLIDQGFQLQNRSQVAALVRSKIGWSHLKDVMLQTGASTTETDQVLATAKARVAAPFKYSLTSAQFWPVVAQAGWVGPRKVWLIEAASPNPPLIFRCGTGMSWWQRRQIDQRAKEECSHRVLVIQAEHPYNVLGERDLIR